MTNTLTILGSASGIPTPNRFNQTMLLEMSDQKVLLEAGDGAAGLLMHYLGKMPELDAIVLSHMHADHVGGLGMVIQTLQIQQRKQALRIYLPQEGVEILQSYLTAIYLPPKVLPFEIEWIPLRNSQTFTFSKELQMHTQPVCHLEALAKYMAPEQMAAGQAFAFSFTAGNNSRVVYSGDVRELAELNQLLKNNHTDLLILECAHYTPGAEFSFFNDRVDQLVLNHIHPQWDDQDEWLQQQCSSHYRGKIQIGADGLQVHF